MDPKQKLAELELAVVEESLKLLAAEVDALRGLPPGKREMSLIEHAVKLCHQVRSLLPQSK